MMTSLTTRVPLNFCPTCNTQLDAATSIGEMNLPKRGDATVCIHCGNILQFDGELKLRIVDVDELRKQPEDVKERLFQIQQAVFTQIIDRANE